MASGHPLRDVMALPVTHFLRLSELADDRVREEYQWQAHIARSAMYDADGFTTFIKTLEG